jgi:beta-glucosidase
VCGRCSGIADVIFGRINPSGRLPYSFPEKLEDVATVDNFPCDPNSKTLKYAEGRCFGYRWHDLEGKPKALYRE